MTSQKPFGKFRFLDRFELLVLVRVKKRSPGCPVENSPTVRYSKKSIFTILFHSPISGSRWRDFRDFLDPTAELFLTYPEYLVAGRIADRHSVMRYPVAFERVKKRFQLHSLFPVNRWRKFILCKRISLSLVCPSAIIAFTYKSSNRTPGASYRHLISIIEIELKKDFIFINSITLNFLNFVSTCQNVFVAVSGRLFELFQRMDLKFLGISPWTDFDRMVIIENLS